MDIVKCTSLKDLLSEFKFIKYRSFCCIFLALFPAARTSKLKISKNNELRPDKFQCGKIRGNQKSRTEGKGTILMTW